MCVRVAKAQSQELHMLDKHSTTELEIPSPTSAQFWYNAYTLFSRISQDFWNTAASIIYTDYSLFSG